MGRVKREGAIRCLVDVNPSDLDGAEDTAHDESGRYKILLLADGEIRTRWAGEKDWRGDDTRQHGECVLEAKEDSEDEWHLVIETKEGACRRLTTPADERNVGTEEGDIIVGADEAVACRDRVNEAVVERLLGGSPRKDGVVVHVG